MPRAVYCDLEARERRACRHPLVREGRVLTRFFQSFDENSTLEGVLADLIIPAVKRRDMILRERGLVSLGLCCLIAKVRGLFVFQD